MKLIAALAYFAIAALTLAVVSAIAALFVMWAWNMFMPVVFGLPRITYMMAFALMTLCSMIRTFTKVQVTSEG